MLAAAPALDEDTEAKFEEDEEDEVEEEILSLLGIAVLRAQSGFSPGALLPDSGEDLSLVGAFRATFCIGANFGQKKSAAAATSTSSSSSSFPS